MSDKDKLPTGLRLSNGYVQMKLTHNGQTVYKSFGLDSPLARKVASIYLAKQREAILLGKANMTPPAPARKFEEVANLYFKRWSALISPEGKPVHSKKAKANCWSILKSSIIPYFKKYTFNAVTHTHVQAWREVVVGAGRSGTTANRHQAVLSSLYSHITEWVKTGAIEAIQLPEENPAKFVKKAKTVKRKRLLTDYEKKKLKLAFTTLGDPEGWEICKLALKTVLSTADLEKLEVGDVVDIDRSKTGVPILLPVTILFKPDFRNWRKRWEKAREQAGLYDADRAKNLEFRDLRKMGINYIRDRYGSVLASKFAGHASAKTTEAHYSVTDIEQLKPLAEDLNNMVEGI